MPVTYLVSNNGKLIKQGSILQYSDYQGNTTKLIPEKIEELMVIGKLEISGSALSLIMEKRIPVSFFYKNGRHNGNLVYDDPKNVFLRHKQHLLVEDQGFVVKTSKDIVRGKIHNQYLFIQRISRKLKLKEFEIGLERLDKLREQLELTDSIPIIRGIEGAAAKIYFPLLGKNFECKWTTFQKRTKNPPEDEINAVLSLLYTVIANKVSNALVKTGLDCAVGTLHYMSFGRKSLVFDLMEEFRTPLADTLACALFNQGVLKKTDFRIGLGDEIDNEEPTVLQVNNEDRKRGVYLTEDGLKKVISALEKKLDQEHQYPIKEKVLSYRKIINEQADLYKQVIGGFVDHYQPMVIK